jgi:hypothetical protein
MQMVADALTTANAEVCQLRDEYEAKQDEWNLKKKSSAFSSSSQPTSSAGQCFGFDVVP